MGVEKDPLRLPLLWWSVLPVAIQQRPAHVCPHPLHSPWTQPGPFPGPHCTLAFFLPQGIWTCMFSCLVHLMLLWLVWIGCLDTCLSSPNLENVPILRISIWGVIVFRNVVGWNEISFGPWDKTVPFSFALLDSSIKQLDPEDMDEIEKIEYWRNNFIT